MAFGKDRALAGGEQHNSQKSAQTKRRWTSIPRHGSALVLGSLLISGLLHIVSGYQLTHVRDGHTPFKMQPRNQVKIRIVDRQPAVKKDDTAKKPDDAKKILEVPQQATAEPEEADYFGNVNHKAIKEQRVNNKTVRDKAKDPGQKGSPESGSKIAKSKLPQPKPQQKSPTDAKSNQQFANKQSEPKPTKAATTKELKIKAGSLAMDAFRPRPRNNYEALLPNANELSGQLNAGYQDFVDDAVAEGDRIDINTTEYRYIGYFTNMRKAIELVWNYPLDAARKGMQGEVGLEFAIGKDGKATRIRVIKSSGYAVLDRAIVDAIRLASPFSPLPIGFRKERILVTGSFRYVLNSFGSH